MELKCYPNSDCTYRTGVVAGVTAQQGSICASEWMWKGCPCGSIHKNNQEVISLKEALEMSSAILTQAEKERYGETDELAEILKTDCNWDCGDSLRACRIIADRVNGQKSINSMQAANNREVYNRAYVLEDRIKKLEEHESRCHGDPESGDPADINQNPQANNPLTKEEIEANLCAIEYYISHFLCGISTSNLLSAKNKLNSYLETK